MNNFCDHCASSSSKEIKANQSHECQKEEETECYYCNEKGITTEAECLSFGMPSCMKCNILNKKKRGHTKKYSFHQTRVGVDKGLLETTTKEVAKLNPVIRFQNVQKGRRNTISHFLQIPGALGASNEGMLTDKILKSPRILQFQEKAPKINILEKSPRIFEKIQPISNLIPKSPRISHIKRASIARMSLSIKKEISDSVKNEIIYFLNDVLDEGNKQKYSKSLLYRNEDLTQDQNINEKCIDKGSLVFLFHLKLASDELSFGAFTQMGWIKGFPYLHDKNSGGFVVIHNEVHIISFLSDSVYNSPNAVSFGAEGKELYFNFQNHSQFKFLFRDSDVGDRADLITDLLKHPEGLQFLEVYNNLF